MKVIEKIVTVEGNVKYVLRLEDGALIEAAVFEHRDAIHFCVPSQVGCPIKCKHCLNTYVSSFVRQMSGSELIEMINFFKADTEEKKLPYILSFSGHGEPMLNWDNITTSWEYLKEDFSDVYITSVGIKDTMKKLLIEGFRPTIYFSIHGSDDGERELIVNPGHKTNVAKIKEIVEFCNGYLLYGGRCVWNYMVCQYNSSKEAAKRVALLSEEIKGTLEIRFTKYIDIGRESGITQISDEEFEQFVLSVKKYVKKHVSVRVSQLEGSESGLACGQLKALVEEKIDGDT